MKCVQCYELFGGIALKIHTFSFFSKGNYFAAHCNMKMAFSCIMQSVCFKQQLLGIFFIRRYFASKVKQGSQTKGDVRSIPINPFFSKGNENKLT